MIKSYYRSERKENSLVEEMYRDEINKQDQSYKRSIAEHKSFMKEKGYEAEFFETIRYIQIVPDEEATLFSVAHDYSIPLIMVKWFIKNEYESWFKSHEVKGLFYYMTGRTA